MRVENRVAIVTGAGSGIGQASAIRLAEEGATVVCADINAEAVNETANQIVKAGFKAESQAIDISDSQACTAIVDATAAKFGAVDILVNNAGVNLPGVFHEVSNETIDRTLNVNVKGAMYLTRAALPHMLKNKRGSIVNMSSVNGLVSEPYLSVYSASKGAIVMFTRGIALDYAKTGIRCNAICPGWVDTPINHAHAKMLGGLDHVYKTIDSFQPIGRPGTSREIANVVLFLASDESSFMTGSIVSADGGMTAQ
ncbi:MAG: glucose 1-dehydrogenase [Actinobacteria bacterium]|nr:glucose 1-dehydrogenase [Actinomycetota bacterium]MTA36019.1 glucose 1-dehydrogenase [Actinomycetota bacterium]